MKKKNRTAKCGHTQPSTSIRTDRVVPPALREQFRNNDVGTQLPANLRQKLRRRDRWRVEDMLAEREQHSGISDIEIWRRLFLPNDLVRSGDMLSAAQVAPPAEHCSGSTWRADGEPIDAVAYCLSAADLLRGGTCAEPMSRLETSEAVVGRMRSGDLPVLLIVDDGEGGLEVWLDAVISDLGRYLRRARSHGRCPGGSNSATGRRHRVLWAYEGLFEPWESDDWGFSGAPAPDWLDAHVERLIALAEGRNGDR